MSGRNLRHRADQWTATGSNWARRRAAQFGRSTRSESLTTIGDSVPQSSPHEFDQPERALFRRCEVNLASCRHCEWSSPGICRVVVRRERNSYPLNFHSGIPCAWSGVHRASEFAEDGGACVRSRGLSRSALRVLRNPGLKSCTARRICCSFSAARYQCNVG